MVMIDLGCRVNVFPVVGDYLRCVAQMVSHGLLIAIAGAAGSDLTSTARREATAATNQSSSEAGSGGKERRAPRNGTRMADSSLLDDHGCLSSGLSKSVTTTVGWSGT
jgi:hypothetical protein